MGGTYFRPVPVRTCFKSIVKESFLRVPLHMRWKLTPDCIFSVGASCEGDVCVSCVCWLSALRVRAEDCEVVLSSCVHESVQGRAGN